MRKFHFASISNVLPCELRLFWYSTRVLNRHLANKLPTCSQQSADSRPTVGCMSVICWPSVGRLLANSRPTVFWGSCSSLFPKFLLMSLVSNHFPGCFTKEFRGVFILSACAIFPCEMKRQLFTDKVIGLTQNRRAGMGFLWQAFPLPLIFSRLPGSHSLITPAMQAT